ncbi:hypothetical protein I79_021419 [Cricetulus griseus]|uniref:Uncharacterized protein n=1 Tax=Cricetulus griseus TaxID=10029 RepID=G3ICM1_CRIGR|nr:hypothetical protein I79_021419 [Cricetulus griseus]
MQSLSSPQAAGCAQLASLTIGRQPSSIFRQGLNQQTPPGTLKSPLYLKSFSKAVVAHWGGRQVISKFEASLVYRPQL